MTPEQRIERARRAQAALDEFLAPAFEVIQVEYGGRLAAVCAKEPWAADKIAALANANRIVDEVKRQLVGLILDADEAKAAKQRTKRIEELTPSKRRLLNIGGF